MFARRAVALSVCLAIAWLGVSGMHGHRTITDSNPVRAHQHIDDFGHGHGGDVQHAVSLLGAHHTHEHVDHGLVDVDPPTKAFAKVSVSIVLIAVLFAFGIFLFAAATPFSVRTVLPPPRPPRPGRRALLLPPSHAPPTPAVQAS